jgi:5,10-methylenetetrahydrofolate reductase
MTRESAGKGGFIMTLSEKLEKNPFVVTIEIQPTVDEEIHKLLHEMNCLRGRVDCVAIPEFKKPVEAVDSLSMGRTLKEQRFDTIYQTTTRGKHRPNLEADLIKAHQIGIDNILVFSEDYTISGTSKEERMFFHVDSAKLFSVMQNLKEGRDLKGQDLEKSVSFFMGAGVDGSQGKRTPDQGLKEMEHMITQGTRFFQTPPVFDLDEFKDFMHRIEPFRVPVLAGVMLLRSAEMARFVSKHMNVNVPDWIIEKLTRSPDKLKASIEIFAELVSGLRDLCQGVHIIPVGWYSKVPKFLDAAKLATL